MKDDFIIYGQDGIEKAFTESLEYHGEWMGDEFVTVTVHSPEPVDFEIGDYLEYRGDAFSILDDPNIIKKARSGSYGEGFTYDNIKLYPDGARMKHIAFNDYVLPDHQSPANKIPYSSLNIFSFFAASVEDLADRLQANLDRMEPGMWAVFTPNHSRVLQRVPSEISKWNNYYDGSYEVQGKTDVNVTVSGLSCWEALKLAYTSFDVSYYITGRIIVIGGTPVSTEHDFRYGKGLGLHEIERTTDESQGVVTKLYCYGSEKNIPYGYYANLGKRIKFQIKQKSEREYIARNPRLLLWVEVPYQDVKKAFNDQGMFEVELECNGNKATFRGWGDTYTYGDEKDDDTLDHETVYLNFYTHQDDFDGAAFYNSVSVGSYVYVTRGMNINKLSSDFVVIPQTYDYDAALSVNRLMLPGFPEQSLFDWVRTNGGTVLDSEKGIVGWKSWSFYASKDKKDPWIMSLKKDREGVREGTATFDESSGNEIYPTIEGTGLDVVSWAEQMDDNGYLGDDPKESEKVFMMQPSTISGYEIDWNDTDGEEVSVSMKDGACVGREFKMIKAQRNEDTKLWELTLERFYDSSIGRYFPYNANASGDRSLYQVMGTGNSHGTRQGNHFVALGIKLPSSYVQLAAVKLLEESLKELKKIDHHRHTYVPKVDEIYMKRQDDFIRNEYRPGHPQTMNYGTVSLHDTLRAGMQIEMSDDDLGLDHYKPYIDVLTIKEDGNNGIPTYDIVMREEKELTLQERLQSQIEGGVKEYVNLTNKGTSVYGEYISKAYEDETEYLVSFLGGLMVDGSLKSPQYKEGEWEMVKDEESGLLTKVHTGEGLGVYRDDEGGWHIELDEATIRKMLRTNELSSLKAFFGSEDYYNPEESVLAVQGNAEFSHHLSSTEFQSGFIGGKGWAIKRVEFTNALGEPETRYTLEIDNITVRNTLRVYEMIISQLRGENDNYIFAAMAEVHHYDPETGKVWLSTEGGKIYMPFRPGDYIMVQRYQPGNTAASGGDGYITKSYELVIIDCNAGGEVDENGDRLDWVLFKNFTTQMVDDSTDPRHGDPDYAGTYYTEEEIDHQVDPVMMTPEQLIKKGDTFCRIDNESDPERKGIIGITSVGPSTPYIDVMYGRKTDPEDFLKGRIGNLEGIKTKEFGWLQGFGAYLINLYGVGKFFNAQTGEAMESRIEATNERLRSVYREKGYDINENDNKVKNGFFQNGLDYWTPCKTDGKPLSAPAEMEYDEDTDTWSMEHSDGYESYMIGTGGDPMLLNGLQLEVQKTTNVELTTSEGVQVLHLNNAGIVQDYDDMTPNTAHKKLVNEEVIDYPEYNKETREYWEGVYRAKIKREHPSWTDEQVEDELNSATYQNLIDSDVADWVAENQAREADLTATEDENDKLYVGVRILPLTGGDLCIGFLEADEYGNVDTPDITNSFTLQFIQDTKWNVEQRNDYPEAQDEWYFPVVTDETRKQGRFLISYTGECYIRFVVLQNNPIDEEQHEYETLFEQNSRRIQMQAKKDEQEVATWTIQHNAIVQTVTDNKRLNEDALTRILGITINQDGTYNFPAGWFDQNVTYGSWIIQTKAGLEVLYNKWDSEGNLIGYSRHTQTADFIRDVIAATASYGNWGQDAQLLLALFDKLSWYWEDNIIRADEITAAQQNDVRSMWNAFKDQYTKTTTACASILANDLVKDSAEKTDLERSLSTLTSKYADMKSSMDAFLALTPPIDTIQHDREISNVTYWLLDATLFEDDYFGVYLNDFCSKLSAISVVADRNLAANVAAVTADFEQYQADLDAAVADTGVTFINWANDTSHSYVKVLGVLDENGNLKDFSTVTQTAAAIASAVEDITWQQSRYDSSTQWEDGTVNTSGTGKYEDIKTSSSSQKRLKTTFGIIPPTSLAKPSVIMSTNYKLLVVYFDKDGNKLSATSWLTPNSETGKIELTVPNNTRSAAFVLKRNSGSINLTEANVRLYIPTVDAGSYVSQTANSIMQTVTDNKEAADAAIGIINNTTIPALSGRVGDLETWQGSTATWMTQTDSSISTLSGRFNPDGSLANTAGLVTGNGTFADLFAAAVTADGNIVKQADLSVYVQEDGNGKIVSGISLSADQLDFSAKDIVWKLQKDWSIYKGNSTAAADRVLHFDATTGNLEIAGQVTAQQTTLNVSDLNSLSNLNVQGNFILDNNKKIQWKNTGGTALSMLVLNDHTTFNQFIVGEATAKNTLDTFVRGYNITFQTGWDATIGTSGGTAHTATLGSDGVLTVEKLKIGDATLQWVTGKGLQVDKTFYSTLGVAALGSGSSSGGGGGDITITEFGVLNASAKTVRLTISGQTKDANLSSLFNGYALSSVLGSMAYETASDYPLVSDIGRLKITINGTSQTWNPLTSGETDLPFTVSGGGGLSWTDLETAANHNIGGSSSRLANLYGTAANFSGTVTANQFKISGATGFLKADGTVDNTSYVIPDDLNDYVKTNSIGTMAAENKTNYWSKTEITALKDYQAVGNLGWTDKAGDAKKVVTSNAIAYWNGRYNDNNSNLAYCSKGAFGDLAVSNPSAMTVSLTPNANDSISLGTSAKKWKNGYFASNLYLGDYKVLTSNTGVMLTGNQTIDGVKTFKGNILANSSSIEIGSSTTPWSTVYSKQLVLCYITSSSGNKLYMDTTNLYNPTMDIAIQGSSKSEKNLSLCAGGGNVGIGASANTSNKLYVSGSVKISTTLDVNGFSISKSGNNYYIGPNSGQTYVSGDWVGSFLPDSSDSRLKDFVSMVELSLEDVANAPIIEFTWKDKHDTRIHLGTYAQYWRPRLSSAVIVKSDGYLTMDYGATALAAAVMTARKVVDHEERIKALEAENKQLREEIVKLKAV